MEQITFGHGSVPIRVVAKLYGKDPNWVRAGIIEGWLPIGIATRDGKEVHSKASENYKQVKEKYKNGGASKRDIHKAQKK